MDAEIARNVTDVRRQIAAAANPICFVIYAPCEKHDRSLVEMYVLRIDRTLGPFIGLASRCVHVDDHVGENLDPTRAGPTRAGDDQPYLRAVRMAQERVRQLMAGQGVDALAMADIHRISTTKTSSAPWYHFS